jgi:alpha-glucosidase
MRFFPCVLLASGLLASCSPRIKGPVTLTSPEKRWQAVITATNPPVLELRNSQNQVLVRQEAGMSLDQGSIPAAGAAVTAISTRTVNDFITPAVPHTAARLDNRYHEATLTFSDKTELIVRLYEEGLAYRFRTNVDGDLIITSEQRQIRFDGDPLVYFGRENDFFSHTEVGYELKKLSELKAGDLASLPLTVRAANGKELMVFSESALEDYAGQWLRVGEQALLGVQPGYPAREVERNDRDMAVEAREPYIAKTVGCRPFPWRTVAVAADDAELLANSLNDLVADPSRIEDTGWIVPGKVQWDWWHNWTWDGKKQPITNETYKKHIDFASKYGIEYILLDEGWYKLGDLMQQMPGIDVPALVKYGQEKKVGVILWVTSVTLKKQFNAAMAQFEAWGVKGLKVDFFQRDDQPEVRFYWKLAAEAAERKFLLDFHGAHKPAGIQCVFPNVLTFEGVRGLEQSKFSAIITPTHDLQLPFTRMVAGPMDYTPGAMKNAQPARFKADSSSPMSQGTRCHELAKFVVYLSPLQMLCDAPPHYDRDPQTMEFLAAVPAAWEESRPLAGKIGEYAAIARRQGTRWFLGAMTNEQPRDLELTLDFLGDGEYELAIWQDGPKAADKATDFEQKKIRVKRGAPLAIRLAPAGGWAAIAVPVP